MKIYYTKAVVAMALLASATMPVAATDLGYCTDAINRNNVFRIGSTEKQGAAIRLDATKLQALKGCTITGISAAFGSSRTNDGTADIFIATSLDGEPIAKKNVKITSAVKMLDLSFDTPYTITGDEPALYLGYTGDITTKGTLLISDRASDMSGCSYLYSEGEWIDSYGLGYGSPMLRARVDGVDTLTDLMAKPMVTDGYFKKNGEYTLSGQIYNFGTTEVNSFDVEVYVGDEAPVVLNFDGVKVAPRAVFDFQLPAFTSETEGIVPFKTIIANVNGGADDVAADNIVETDLFFYPENMERSILLEGFTGQSCHNCPAGHTAISNFLASDLSTPVIEVMHHAGYSPDIYTMDSDLDYTYYYGGSSTFAPAMMLNRTLFPSLGTVPVLNVSSNLLTQAYALAENTEPYVSLALETEYDPATRQLKVTLNSLTHNALPSANNVINVVLAQNGLIGNQQPVGDGYVHNAVFRGTLTGNSWGLQLPAEASQPGGTASWSTTLTLPEYIFSDYWASTATTDEMKLALSTKSDPDNMYIVAYIGSFGDTPADHRVYNAVEAGIGKSHIQGGMAGIPDIALDTDGLAIRVVDGSIVVDGDCDTLSVVTLDGRQVNAAGRLAPGIYVARATKGNAATVKKIQIRR